jgi:lysophospholipase L1-like esterase
VFLVFALIEKKKDIQYDIVVLGDSVIGNVGANGIALTDYIEERLGKSTFKGGLGGTSMSVQSDSLWGSASNMEWNMVKLATAIWDNDWKSQLATLSYAENYQDVNNQILSYFPETINTLSQIDFSALEILVIEHGTNDYSRGVSVDNEEDPFDVTTFGGALRTSLKLLREKYPELRIVVMSPIYCALGEEREKKCYNTKYGDGGYLEEYVEKEKQIAEEFGVEWIDAYHNSGINESNEELYLHDGLHLSSEGHKKLGEFLADYLETNKR